MAQVNAENLKGTGYSKMPSFDIVQTDEGVTFTVKVVPGSSRTAIAGTLGSMLKVKIAAPPEKGKANQCLTEFLAKKLRVKKQAVTIISGLTNPVKQVQVTGVSVEDVVSLSL